MKVRAGLLVLAVAGAIQAFTIGARAGLDMTIGGFIESCQAGGEQARHCVGYVQGMADLQEAYTLMQASAFFCVERGTSPYSLVQAVIDWGVANPDHLDTPAPAGVLAAFKGKYPCN
jgi:hypothetical protein